MAVLGHEMTIRPLYISKLNTVLQIVLVAVSAAGERFWAGHSGPDSRIDLVRGIDNAGVGCRVCLEYRAWRISCRRDGPKPLPDQLGELSAPVYHATRVQRFALIIGLLVAFWLALQLFASVLAPFVAAAVIAYALDPPTTQLTRLGIRRGRCSADHGRGADRFGAALRPAAVSAGDRARSACW